MRIWGYEDMRIWGYEDMRGLRGRWRVPSGILNLQSIVRHSSAPPSQSKSGDKKMLNRKEKDVERVKVKWPFQFPMHCNESDVERSLHALLKLLKFKTLPTHRKQERMIVSKERFQKMKEKLFYFLLRQWASGGLRGLRLRNERNVWYHSLLSCMYLSDQTTRCVNFLFFAHRQCTLHRIVLQSTLCNAPYIVSCTVALIVFCRVHMEKDKGVFDHFQGWMMMYWSLVFQTQSCKKHQ